jgi:hypothetical protein
LSEGANVSATDRTILLQLFNEEKLIEQPDAADTDFFELFSAYHHLKGYDLDYSDIEGGVVDGAEDGGIDSVYCFVDGSLIESIDHQQVRKNAEIDLFIITTKFQDSFKTGVLSDIRSTLSDLLTLDSEAFDIASENYNDDVVEAFESFRALYVSIASKFPTLRVHVIFCTASSKAAGPEITTRLDSIKADIQDQFSDAIITAEAFDAKRLLARVREAPDQVRQLTVSGAINRSNGPSYVCLATLNNYAEFISRSDGSVEHRLFDDNVRDWAGDVDVNRSITSTLSDPGNVDFWWLNNGVSIICESASLSGGTLLIKNPKIVNGLQTSRQLHAYATEFDLDGDDRLILVRAIVAEDEDTRAKIIRATNRQTPIQEAQLAATSSVHKDIELFLRGRGIFYERRKNYWKNHGKKRSEIVSITDVAQAMLSTVGAKPHVARGRPGSMMDTAFDPTYDLKVYEKAIDLVRSTDALIGETQPECGRRDRNNIKYHVVAKTVHHMTSGNVSPAAFLKNRLPSPDRRSVIIEEVLGAYFDHGGNDRIAKSEAFWQHVRDDI